VTVDIDTIFVKEIFAMLGAPDGSLITDVKLLSFERSMTYPDVSVVAVNINVKKLIVFISVNKNSINLKIKFVRLRNASNTEILCGEQF